MIRSSSSSSTNSHHVPVVVLPAPLLDVMMMMMMRDVTGMAITTTGGIAGGGGGGGGGDGAKVAGVVTHKPECLFVLHAGPVALVRAQQRLAGGAFLLVLLLVPLDAGRAAAKEAAVFRIEAGELAGEEGPFEGAAVAVGAHAGEDYFAAHVGA